MIHKEFFRIIFNANVRRASSGLLSSVAKLNFATARMKIKLVNPGGTDCPLVVTDGWGRAGQMWQPEIQDC